MLVFGFFSFSNTILYFSAIHITFVSLQHQSFNLLKGQRVASADFFVGAIGGEPVEDEEEPFSVKSRTNRLSRPSPDNTAVLEFQLAVPGK
ncbi:hypothetical protein [Paenibacillus graminis]|uniref:Uncharacterized protein n=1 Tax=Paenibacillus graminis TaxID=189425 RepID=A0A089M2D7_9BACL|nr:hypothetical protein [Paenibacillus graminis]AIQ67367.1 hypothetical protein PGRAT_06720 [Paenibacillus graminis]